MSVYQTLSGYVRKNYVLAALILFCAGWIFLQLIYLIAIFFISFIFVIGFLPVTRYLRSLGLNHVIAALIPYVVMFALIILVFAPFVSKAVSQFQNLVGTLAIYWEKIPELFSIGGVSVVDIRNAIQSQINAFVTNLLSFTGFAVSIIVTISTTITLSVYAQIDYDRIRSFALATTKAYLPDIDIIYQKLEDDLGSWIAGQILLCVIMGILSFIVLTILRVPFAPSLALLSGLLELLPTIGPILAAIPAILIALQTSVALAVVVALAYTGIQFLENSIIVPRVMSKAVNLHPLIIIPALIVGYQFFGIVGSVLAIPGIVSARIIWVGIHIPLNQ
jgi:predicted PurR-regulated permease PerM